MTEAQTIAEDIMRAAREAYHSAFGGTGSASQTDVYEAIAKAILAERESAAALVEQMLNDPRFTKDARAKLGLMIAARAIRRGRHLSDSERLENVLLWAKGEGEAA